MIKIFNALSKNFETNGLGAIQPLKCIETKKMSLNGWSVDVEVLAKFKDIIKKDNIVVVDTKEKGPQPFRINNPKTKHNVISFTADHVVFDLQKYILADARPTDLAAEMFLSHMKDRTDVSCPFNFHSQLTDRHTKYFIRKTMLEAMQTTEDLFNAEFDVDQFDITLKAAVGQMSDTKLLYGKNIEDVEIDEDWSQVVTKIMPVGPDGILLPESYITSKTQYETQYTSIVDFDIETQKEDDIEKTEEEIITELRTLATEFIDQHQYPKVKYTLKADIEQSLKIGDIVPVHHPLVTLQTRVQEYTYDCNAKRVTKIVYGNFDRSVKKAFDDIKNQIIETQDELRENEKSINRVKREAKKNTSAIEDTYRKGDIDAKEKSIIEQTNNNIKSEVSLMEKTFDEKLNGYSTFEETSTSISQSQDEIKLEVQHVINSLNDDIQKRFNSNNIQMTDEYTAFVKSSLQDVQNIVDGKVSQEQLVEYVRFSGATVEIGKVGEKFRTVITNDKMSFYQSTEEVAYISNNEMYILKARIIQELQVGQYMFKDEGELGFSLMVKEGVTYAV